jgi:RNA polymerase sigma factor (sigma-70 family)
MTDWRAIVADHGPDVWRAVYRILTRDEDAWDSYQEVFLEAFRSAPRTLVRDWGAYLGTLATRRALDRLRRRIRDRELARVIDRLPAPEAGGPSPHEQVAAEELMDRIRSAVAELPERQAEVFWLSCIEGVGHPRIAEQLRITPGAVRMLLSRARSALAEALDSSPSTLRSEP